MFKTSANIEELLISLNGIRRAEAPSYLYTSIQARPGTHNKTVFDALNGLFAKPIPVISFLFIILLLNEIVLQSNLKTMAGKSENTPGDNFSGESGIAAEEFFAVDVFEEILLYEIPTVTTLLGIRG